MEKNNSIDRELLNSAMNYNQYRQLVSELFQKGKATGNNHSEAMLLYTRINLQRMKRLDKTIELNPNLQEVLQNNTTEMIWLVITEGWCGDAAQNIPLFNKITEADRKIELKLILRDENTALMDRFLTNGGRSIPKLIALRKDDLKVLGTWGPRPEAVQKMVEIHKSKPEANYTEFSKQVQLWYIKDKTTSIQKELSEKVLNWAIEAQ